MPAGDPALSLPVIGSLEAELLSTAALVPQALADGTLCLAAGAKCGQATLAEKYAIGAECGQATVNETPRRACAPCRALARRPATRR